MSLLDALLKEYREEVQSGSSKAAFVDQFVENVEKKVLRSSTNSQHNEFTEKNNSARPRPEAAGFQDPNFLIPQKTHESQKFGPNIQNVEDVACVRESESANLTSSIHVRTPSAPPPVDSIARTSNILNKLSDCDSCPACCDWSGYGHMRRGRYCFFSAVLKGKPAWPVPIAEAQRACPKENESDPTRN